MNFMMNLHLQFPIFHTLVTHKNIFKLSNVNIGRHLMISGLKVQGIRIYCIQNTHISREIYSSFREAKST
jgi:hypothetical protein